MSLFVCNLPIVVTALFKLSEKPATAPIPGSTKMSTHILFQRKTETAVDGTVVTLDGLNTHTTQTTTDESDSKIATTGDYKRESLFPDPKPHNAAFSTASNYSTSSASYHGV